MSEIKLKKEELGSLATGINPDLDELKKPFNRLTFSVKSPVTNENIYWELNKQDSESLLTEKQDGIYIEEDKVNYLKESWQSQEYEDRLSLAWVAGERGVDIPEHWYDTQVQIIPRYTAMWDDVYVNKEKVKIDYSVGCTGDSLDKLNNLISLISDKFPNEYNIKSHENNIVGMYLPDHKIRPPYKSQNTITVYHLYYPESWMTKLLKDYQCPDFDYKYCFWFGLKYDLDSGKRYFKLVIRDDDKTSNYQEHPESFIPRPQLPVCNEPYFAKIYSQDGTEADEYDVFFSTTPELMKRYCEENELDFPIPEDKENGYIWTYGIVYDKNTLDIKQIKGYIKVSEDPDTQLFIED